MNEGPASVAEVTESYYDSTSADTFYASIWGGNDIHIGIYEREDDSVYAASSRTVAAMASRLRGTVEGLRVLDIGSGYGGSARTLAALFDCRVDCLNLSQVQNERNRELCRNAGLDKRIQVVHGSFEAIPGPPSRYEVVWSQDAILHSGAREQVLSQVARVLRPGGQLIFTDPMQTDSCPPDVLQPVLDRIHLDSLASPGFYRKTLSALGFEEIGWTEMPEQLRRHYATVRAELEARHEEMVERCGIEYVTRMLEGLGHWVDAADRGYLTWGIFHFRLR
jgi:sarcosine/dimethylglycine N-methyltransferase